MQSYFINDLLSEGAARNRPSLPNDGSINYGDPRDNLYAFGKIWAGYDTPVIGAFHGLMYARFPKKRPIPLFGFAGTGVMQAILFENGDLGLKSRETGFFTDLVTGEILETWENPFTGEVNDVYHFYNDLTVGRITPEMPEFLMDASGSSPTLMNEGTALPDSDGKYPFILPIEQYGDDLMLSWDYTHEYDNPVCAHRWPKASTGPRIAPSEHFTLSVSKAELEDRDTSTCRMKAGFSRMSEFWPWMHMGGSGLEDGLLFGRMFSHKGLDGYGDVPSKILDYLEKHAPEMLVIPDCGWDVNMDRLDTWKTYVKDVAPEVDGSEHPERDDFKPPTGSGSRS